MIRLKTMPAGFAGKPPRRPATASKPKKRPQPSSGPPDPPERETQRSIMAYLESLGACVIRVNSGAVKAEGRYTRFNSLPGCPDLLFCLPIVGWDRGGGLFGAVEVKSAKGRVTDRQAEAQRRLREAGAVVIVARSVDDVRKALQQEGLTT